MSRPTNQEERKRIFLQFIEKLIGFWSGLKRIKTDQTYQVFVIRGRLPMSSTCFYQLKLPNEVRSKAELYRVLVIAVYGVEQGIGLYGGKHSKKKMA